MHSLMYYKSQHCRGTLFVPYILYRNETNSVGTLKVSYNNIGDEQCRGTLLVPNSVGIDVGSLRTTGDQQCGGTLLTDIFGTYDPNVSMKLSGNMYTAHSHKVLECYQHCLPPMVL